MNSGGEVRIIALGFSASFDSVSHEILFCKLIQLFIDGPFLYILTKFLSNRVQKVVVNGHSCRNRNVVSGVQLVSVLILYTHDIWYGLENRLVAYVDGATLIAVYHLRL